MAVLPRYISAGNIPADGPVLGSSVLGVQNELRTVRSLGADGPPPTENSRTETLRFLCVLTF